MVRPPGRSPSLSTSMHFVVMSAASVPNHDFCSIMATELHAIVASVEYCLAPEHLLPSAYDDAADAMRWLDTYNDDWIREHADLSNCYIMGLSVGTNMAFRVGHGESLKNVRIKGLILHHPFFGGLKRTMFELTMWNNKNLPMAVVDLLWELALLVGVDFDHEYCNPKTTDGSKGIMEMMRIKGCRMMLVGGDGDPRIDRQREFAEELRERGVEVEAWFGEGVSTCFFRCDEL